jgi:hypothetical protein
LTYQTERTWFFIASHGLEARQPDNISADNTVKGLTTRYQYAHPIKGTLSPPPFIERERESWIWHSSCNYQFVNYVWKLISISPARTAAPLDYDSALYISFYQWSLICILLFYYTFSFKAKDKILSRQSKLFRVFFPCR